MVISNRDANLFLLEFFSY